MVVDDFDKAAEMLGKLHFYEKRFYQENKRELHKLGDTEFAIDSWPKIPPYLEIESTSKEEVERYFKVLELE